MVHGTMVPAAKTARERRRRVRNIKEYDATFDTTRKQMFPTAPQLAPFLTPNVTPKTATERRGGASAGTLLTPNMTPT